MKVYHHTCFAMGTRFNLVIPGMEDMDGKPLGNKVAAILAEQENMMSRFQENGELWMINRDAFLTSVTLSKEMSQILKACDSFYENTLGAFDPALLPVMKKTRKAPGSGIEAGTDTVSAIGWKNVAFDQQAGTVRFVSENAGLDLGGFGKGWAMEKIINYLKGEKVDAAFISFGESTICGLGSHPLGGPWQVSIPAKGKGKPLLVELKDESFSVSGLKLKDTENGKTATPHIFSPRKGKWIEEDKMVLVQSVSPLRAEVLSTACSAAGDHQKIHILDAYKEEQFFVCEKDEWRKGI